MKRKSKELKSSLRLKNISGLAHWCCGSHFTPESLVLLVRQVLAADTDTIQVFSDKGFDIKVGTLRCCEIGKTGRDSVLKVTPQITGEAMEKSRRHLSSPEMCIPPTSSISSPHNTPV
jgi:hypothetical protein